MKLPKKKTVIAKNDSLFSRIIRASGRCDWCGRTTGALHCSHIEGRQAKNLRWDLQNAVPKCFQCHRRWHDYPLEGAEWFNKKYPERAKYLKKKMQEVKKMTVHDYLNIQEELKKELNLS